MKFLIPIIAASTFFMEISAAPRANLQNLPATENHQKSPTQNFLKGGWISDNMPSIVKKQKLQGEKFQRPFTGMQQLNMANSQIHPILMNKLIDNEKFGKMLPFFMMQNNGGNFMSNFMLMKMLNNEDASDDDDDFLPFLMMNGMQGGMFSNPLAMMMLAGVF